jgi:hypothetical protein
MAVSIFPTGVSGQEENQELVQIRGQFEKEIEFVARPIRDRYLSRLETLKRALGSRGDARGSAAVQDEIDRIREIITGQQVVSKFAGTWKVTYNVGTVRHYAITSDGQVTQDEHDGKPPKTAKLTMKGNDVLLDLQEGWIERLRIKGKTLSVENYNPKTLYPASQANALGVGTLVAGRKE